MGQASAANRRRHDPGQSWTSWTEMSVAIAGLARVLREPDDMKAASPQPQGKAAFLMSSQQRLALATITAFAVTSMALVALGGGTTAGLSAMLTGSLATTASTASASSLGLPAAVAALAAATAAGRSVWLWRGDGTIESGAYVSSKVDYASHTTAEPLMGKQEPSISDPDSSRSTEIPESIAPAESDEELSQGSSPHLKRRDPFKGHRQQLLLAARKRTASWVALLIRGFDVTADGERCEMRLQGPSWKKLTVGKQVFPLVRLGLRLEEGLLRLVANDAESDDVGERVVDIEPDVADWALELALALKALRAEADTGAGIGDWEERPADNLKRPPPAE